MNRKIISILATAAFAVLPTMAFASTSITNLTFDGAPNIINGTAGQSNDALLTVSLSNNNDSVDSVSYEFPGTSLPFQCVAVNPADIQAGQYSIDLNNTDGSNPGFILPMNAGLWPVKVKTYGAHWPAVDTNCSGTPNDTKTFNSVVSVNNVTNVVTSNSNSTGVSTSNSTESALQTLVNSLTAEVNALLHPTTTPAIVTTSSTSGTCAQLAGAMIGTQMGVYNNANQVLQGFLLFQHESIPALAAGASFGYFGPQTQAALTSFKAQYGCM